MTRRYCTLLAGLAVCTLVTTSVHAVEVSGGVSVAGILLAGQPRLAVTPHAGASWSSQSGGALSVDNFLNILPAVNALGIGFYDQTSLNIGYSSEAIHARIGPTLSIYSMPACTSLLCGRVVGVGAGGHAQVDFYLVGPFGLSVSVNVDWAGGSSLALRDGVAAMLMIGPVIRWRSN